MPANEFEKQVQKQMEEFRLEPSASVWENVEREIREKRRRRIIFFFILPLAAGLLVFSLYQFLYMDKKTETAHPALSVAKEEKLPAEQGKISPAAVEKPSASEKLVSPVENTITQKETVQSKTGERKFAPTDIVPSNNSDVETGLQKVPVTNYGRNTTTKKVQDNSLAITVDAPAKQKIIKNESEPAKVLETEEKKVLADNAVSSKDTKAGEGETGITGTSDVKKDSTLTKDDIAQNDKKETTAPKKTISGKLKWGIDLSAGLAYNNKSSLSLAKAQAADMNYAAPGSATGSPVAPVPPSVVRHAPGFRVGIIAEMQVSNRSRFSGALQYAYTSNRIKVGSASDTMLRLSNANNLADVNVEKVYRGAQNNDYVNKYHFIRLPFMYHWQINKGKKLAIEWSNGVGVSYLFATDALVYSKSLGGIYYEDENAFNKMHVDLSTGFSLRIKAKNGNEWVIGPVFSFDMSRLVKEDNKQYLMFGGIHAKLLWPQKKNK